MFNFGYHLRNILKFIYRIPQIILNIWYGYFGNWSYINVSSNASNNLYILLLTISIFGIAICYFFYVFKIWQYLGNNNVTKIGAKGINAIAKKKQLIWKIVFFTIFITIFNVILIDSVFNNTIQDGIKYDAIGYRSAITIAENERKEKIIKNNSFVGVDVNNMGSFYESDEFEIDGDTDDSVMVAKMLGNNLKFNLNDINEDKTAYRCDYDVSITDIQRNDCEEYEFSIKQEQEDNLTKYYLEFKKNNTKIELTNCSTFFGNTCDINNRNFIKMFFEIFGEDEGDIRKNASMYLIDNILIYSPKYYLTVLAGSINNQRVVKRHIYNVNQILDKNNLNDSKYNILHSLYVTQKSLKNQKAEHTYTHGSVLMKNHNMVAGNNGFYLFREFPDKVFSEINIFGISDNTINYILDNRLDETGVGTNFFVVFYYNIIIIFINLIMITGGWLALILLPIINYNVFGLAINHLFGEKELFLFKFKSVISDTKDKINQIQNNSGIIGKIMGFFIELIVLLGVSYIIINLFIDVGYSIANKALIGGGYSLYYILLSLSYIVLFIIAAFITYKGKEFLKKNK